jgi:hypothetical protein
MARSTSVIQHKIAKNLQISVWHQGVDRKKNFRDPKVSFLAQSRGAESTDVVRRSARRLKRTQTAKKGVKPRPNLAPTKHT